MSEFNDIELSPTKIGGFNKGKEVSDTYSFKGKFLHEERIGELLDNQHVYTDYLREDSMFIIHIATCTSNIIGELEIESHIRLFNSINEMANDDYISIPINLLIALGYEYHEEDFK